MGQTASQAMRNVVEYDALGAVQQNEIMKSYPLRTSEQAYSAGEPVIDVFSEHI